MSNSISEAIAANYCCELCQFDVGDRLPLSIRSRSPMYGYPRSRYSIDFFTTSWTCEGNIKHTITVLNDILRRRVDE